MRFTKFGKESRTWGYVIFSETASLGDGQEFVLWCKANGSENAHQCALSSVLQTSDNSITVVNVMDDTWAKYEADRIEYEVK